METRKRAKEIAALLHEKKGQDIVILDMKDASLMADYFILVSGSNARQTKALEGYVDEYMHLQNIQAARIEGKQEGSWILADYGDIVLHLFTEEMRRYYDLERLWKDAKRLTW